MTVATPQPSQDKPIPLGNVPALVQSLYGVRISRQTVYNWITKGREAGTGSRATLRYVVKVGRFFTTQKALEEFVSQIGSDKV